MEKEKYIIELQKRKRKSGEKLYKVKRKAKEVECEECGEKWLVRKDRIMPRFCRSCMFKGDRNPRYGETEWNDIDIPTIGESNVSFREKNNLLRWKRKKILIQHMGNKCFRCKKSYPICVYQWHHLEPQEKKIEMSQILLRGWDSVLLEASKCVLVCSNCHKIIHYGEERLDAIKI